MKYTLKGRGRALWMLFLLGMTSVLPTHAQTPESMFTITGGVDPYMWYVRTVPDAPLNVFDGTDRARAVRFDRSVAVPVGQDTNWIDYYYAGSDQSAIDTTAARLVDMGGWTLRDPKEPTLHVKAGEHYLGINITDPNHPTIETYNQFNPYCGWFRTGFTGYYYQVWGDKSYFLYIDNATKKPAVTVVSSSNAPQGVTYWYDWDFGMAMQENFDVNGQPSHAYYWLTWDNTASAWYMSPNSYNRPETKLYIEGTGDQMIFDKYFCGADGNNKPKGYGALYMTLTRTVHPKTISNRPDGTGLTGIDLTGDGSADASANLPYGSTLTITPLFTPGTVQVTRAYAEYTEETERKGLNTNWRMRQNEGEYRSWGQLTAATHYYYDDNTLADEVNYSPSGLHATAPTPVSSTLALNAEKYTYEVNNSAKRYVALTPSGDKNSCTMGYISMPPNPVTVTVTVTAHYENGTTDNRQVTVTLGIVEPQAVGDPTNAPVIAGAVFGGGRMANVGGTTGITMHRCDTVPAVYGGNDISGQVQGNGGSTITLGTSYTEGYTVHIGSVYGGGNGYYDYQYQSGDGSTLFVEGPAMTTEKTQFKGDVRTWSFTNAGNGAMVISGMANGTYIPTIKQSNITVAHNDVLVDSVFGGAKNAFLTGYNDGEKSKVATINHQAGTVYAEFGGNNYGGTLGAATNVVTINVSGTRTTDRNGVDQSIQETGAFNSTFGGFGREFGIRYLYGGGNKVVAPTVAMNITGGMVDTVFAGGNSATVSNASCIVECASTIFTNPTAIMNNANHWVGNKWNYNVRCLFGGNNQAEMAILPKLILRRGGIGTVYGGGNAGRMTHMDALPADPDITQYFAGGANPDIEPDSDYFQAPTILGTFINIASDNMKIDYVYGGCNKASVDRSTYVRMAGGQVGSIFGGCNVSGDVGSTTNNLYGTYVVMKGGTVWENIYGGANGAYHCNDQHTSNKSVSDYVYKSGLQFRNNVGEAFDPYDDYLESTTYIPTHNNTTLVIAGGHVYGNAYGGANLAHVGFEPTKFIKNGAEYTMPSMKCGSVHLSMRGYSHVHGNVFGGGNMSFVYGLGYLTVKGNSQIDGSLFAGNDKVGMVDAFGKYTVYAGGSTLTDGAVITSSSEQLNENQSGNWTSKYSSYIRIEDSPRIAKVYGGGNGAYNYDGTRPEYGSQLELCSNWTNDSRPRQLSTFIDINTDGRHPSLSSEEPTVASIDTVFGGGNGIGVQKTVKVLINASYSNAECVGTVFGGNNRDNMSECVPDVLLSNGMVHDVYGGCNAGNMTFTKNITNGCGDVVEGVSSYVLVNSDAITVNGSIFGGCNRANVDGMAYVEIRKTSTDGIDTVYGGNNISGTVTGNTRIDMLGGKAKTLYGGSNGYYSYYMLADGVYRTYPYSINPADTTGKLIAITSGTPVVAETQVNIFGGTVVNNVYGGGRMGDCETTYVTVDDSKCGPTGAIIEGIVYGGGEGDTSNLHLTQHYGNVTGTTHVDLYHASRLGPEGASGPTAKAFGGGKGGDVLNTEITVYDDWDIPFNSIFGGCWGSDVRGTAHLTMDGKDKGLGQNALMVYGGNDLTGNVHQSLVDINSGHYGTIYGAGNGNYDASRYASLHGLTVPNSETVVVNFNGGTVDSNLYGGGRFGTTFKYRTNNEGRYIDGDGNIVNQARLAAPDTNLSYANAYVDPTKYGYIIVNVHDGTFYQNIYAGARGLTGSNKQLVYGLKMLNMDGGNVRESVYGGSESVDDGYGHSGECITGEPKNTERVANTMRPSSIMNLAGGTIKNNIYGAGYIGKVYGSAYINIGMEAINSSSVWDTIYKTSGVSGQTPEYLVFKPGNGLVPALTANDLYLDMSVYGGANWGSNTGSYSFTTQGFYGGETRVLVDGEGYSTDDDESSPLSDMNIGYSIIGSGTSAKGGDVLNRIEVRNYGALSNSCHATKTLRSIQRADTLWLHNTAIRYVGATDAVSAYPSQQYTINRIDHVYARGYNILEIDALMTNIGEMNFYEEDLDAGGHLVLAQRGNLYNNASTPDFSGGETVDQCPKRDICTQVGNVIDPTDADKRHTALIVNDGVNVDIINEHGQYGSVAGFAYLLAEEGTNAIVAARSKSELTGTDEVKALVNGNLENVPVADRHINDGGFIGVCQSQNKTHTFIPYGTSGDTENGWGINWDGTDRPEEFPYENYYANYRVWSIGEGRRSRYAVVLAHANPSKLTEHNCPMWIDAKNSSNYKFGFAQAKLTMPASAPGHYYTLSDGGIVLRDDNSAMRLADSAWNPIDSNSMRYWGETWPNGPVVKEATGTWETHDRATSGAYHIHNRPGMTFGLVMASGANFEGDDIKSYTDPKNDASTWNNGASIIPGNANVSLTSSYRSGKVGGSIANANPEFNLYLTYDTNFSSTLLGNVSFTLEERDQTGKKVGTVDVVVTIATIIDKFTDQQYEVLAMYNEGRNNTFTRKAVLPATLQHRDLYLTAVEWGPTDEDGDYYSSADYNTESSASGTPVNYTGPQNLSTIDTFFLSDVQTQVTGSKNTFTLSIKPADNITSTITTNVGWHSISEEKINLYQLATLPINDDVENPALLTSGSKAKVIAQVGGASSAPRSMAMKHTTKGLKVGELDGRGLAAINIDLGFDGNMVYPERDRKGYIGKAILTFESWAAGVSQGTFQITVYVKTRKHGDTIYLASSETLPPITYDNGSGVTRTFGGYHARTRQYDYDQGDNYWDNPREHKVGKKPSLYVSSFEDALNEEIYQEGDVIAIIGEVDINPGEQWTIQGADYCDIPIIRYSGDHIEYPGEQCVYRGTMINLQGGTTSTTTAGPDETLGTADDETITEPQVTSLLTRCIYFDGSFLSKIKKVTCNGSEWLINSPVADTNVAYGPVIAVNNGTSSSAGLSTAVVLENQTVVTNNYNVYTDNDITHHGSAINLTNGGQLEMRNNVTIENNFTNTATTSTEDGHVVVPHDGAVYVNGGVVSLLESHEATAIIITDNYMLPLASTSPNKTEVIWGTYVIKPAVGPNPAVTRYIYDPTTYSTARKANVFLTRTEPDGTTAQKEMTDKQTDVIIIGNTIPKDTKIGVSKWFPGYQTRDTIRIVYIDEDAFTRNPSYLKDAYTFGNFISDDPTYDTFFNNNVNKYTLYLHRCATFRQQLKGEEILAFNLSNTGDYTYLDYLPSYTNNGETVTGGIKADDLLHYGYLPDASCPTGGDSLIYRVQGGFFPYTYVWSGDITKERTTSTNNNVIMKETEGGDYTHYLQAIADTIYTEDLEMTRTQTEKTINLSVTATDIAGCELTKDITVTMKKNSDAVVDKFVETNDGWTNRATDEATGTRNFRGVKITPMVWADRSAGVIYVKDLTAPAAPGHVYDTFYLEDEAGGRHDLETQLFCEGDVIKLATAPNYNPTSPNATKFIMWDFDPYYTNPVNYVVPAENTTIIAYYGPQTYWTEHITNTTEANAAYDDNYYYTNRNGKSYVTTHNGDVHIYDENGLAWFISVVNGLNGTQARPFYFNNVYLHDKTGGYDMKDYLWTPVGTAQHPFRGRLIGVTAGDYSTEPAADGTRVTVKNIIVNEPNVNYAGFFGHLDTATIQSIKLEGALVRGSQYVGALAADAVNDVHIVNCEVSGSADNERNAATTILTTHYVSGGMVGNANNIRIESSKSHAKYVGDAVYTGGVIGYGTSATTINTTVVNTDRNLNRMQAVYSGGIAGSLNGVTPMSSPSHLRHNSESTPTQLRSKSAEDGRSYVLNNYVQYRSGNAQRVGGLVGYAKNTVIENNYVYGDLEGEATEGGVGAVLDDGTSASHNYYESSAATQSVGQHRGTAMSSQNIAFSGKGNNVTLGSSDYGVNNLTRVLNIWVRTHGADYKTWRSDLDDENHGYPVFGTPDMIPVSTELTVTGCDSVEWDGTTYLFDDEVVSHIVDSVMMVDSTHTLHIVVHHATREQVSDSVDLGDSYSGYGFYLTATEVALMQATMELHGSATIVLSDTLQSELTGCDSIITLQLTVNRKQGIVEASNEFQLRVYPNPTTSRVTIEASEAMSHVELYDNEGRRLQDYNTRNTETTTIDVSHYPTGAYYLRVHTADNVTIQKLIKK